MPGKPTYGSGFLELMPQISQTSLGGFQQGLLGKLGPMGAMAGAAIAAGIGAALAAGIGAFKLGESFDEAFDTIRIGTGATGAILDALKEDFKGVVSDIPTDFGAASTAIADLNTRLGLTGGPLQDMSKQVLELSRITGTDLESNIASVSRTFGDWAVGTKDQSGALDAMFRASQATGISVDALGQMMVTYGAPLRQLGFGFEESAALIGKFEQEGVNAELVMGSMRIALGKMAREGEPAQETFSRITEQIKNAGSASEANAMALELFGARAGPDMAAAIREGRFEIDGLLATVEGGTETILGAAAETNDWRESLQVLGNKVMVALEPIATGLFTAVGDAITFITPHVEKAVAWFAAELPKAIETVRPFFEVIVKIVKGLWDLFGPVIVGFLKTQWRIIGEVIKAGVAVFTFIIDAVTTAVEWVRSQWDGIVDFFRGLPDRIARAASGMWDGIVDAFKDAINAIIRAWNRIDLEIGPFSIPEWIPGLGGNKFHIKDVFPDIGLFHSGGTVPGGPGDEFLALLQGGEQIRSRAEVAMADAGDVRDGRNLSIAVETTGDARVLAREIKSEIAWKLGA